MISKAELRLSVPDDMTRLLEAADRLRRTRQLEEKIRERQAKQAETSPQPSEEK